MLPSMAAPFDYTEWYTCKCTMYNSWPASSLSSPSVWVFLLNAAIKLLVLVHEYLKKDAWGSS